MLTVGPSVTLLSRLTMTTGAFKLTCNSICKRNSLCCNRHNDINFGICIGRGNNSDPLFEQWQDYLRISVKYKYPPGNNRSGFAIRSHSSLTNGFASSSLTFTKNLDSPRCSRYCLERSNTSLFKCLFYNR